LAVCGMSLLFDVLTGAAIFLCLFRISVGAPACPDNLAALSNPNCGVDDPECPLEAPFHRVNITEDGVYRHIETSYCPPYDWSCVQNAKGRRPCARRASFKVPLYPSVAEDKVHLGLGWPPANPTKTGDLGNDLPSIPLAEGSPMLGAIAVLVNGVALNGLATKLSEALHAGEPMVGEDRWVDAVHAESWMDDGCFGHLSGGGNYHTHAGLWSSSAQREACKLPVDASGEHSKLLGWAFDGYGLYGPRDEGGRELQLGELDACGGHSQEAKGGYHYHLIGGYPYALECYHGCPEASNNGRFKTRPCVPKMKDHAPLQPPPATTEHAEL